MSHHSSYALPLSKEKLARIVLYRLQCFLSLSTAFMIAGLGCTVHGAGSSVFTWGSNVAGVLDIPNDLTNVIAVAAGRSHSLALRSDGTVVGWGDNIYSSSLTMGNESNWVAIAAGDRFSVGLRRDGTVGAFGNVLMVPDGLSNIASVAAGPNYGLLLTRDGTLVIWDENARPLPPPNATNLLAVAAGQWHAIGLRRNGAVMCWGNNDYGQAAPPTSATNVIAIAAGDFFSLALREDGTLLAWGDNRYGQLSIPDEATNILAVSAGPAYAMALRDDGRVIVWGDTSSGQREVPAALSFPSAISAGGSHCLALVEDGALSFVREPYDRNVAAGETVALSAWARGGGPVTYQWFKDGTNLLGARSAYLVLPNPQASDMGVYSVVASNSVGAITSRVAVVTVTPHAPVFVLEPTSVIAVPGSAVKLEACARGTDPVTYQWRLNGVELPGATEPTLTLSPCQWADTGTYDVVVENGLGRAVSRSATVTFEPTVDSSDLQVNDAVFALAVQRDGKTVIGGAFTSVAGQPRSNLARLNADGTLDLDFSPQLTQFQGCVYALAVQANEQILVGGQLSYKNLARLNPDGSIDSTFDPIVFGDRVYRLVLQPDGKILLAGSFTSVNGQPRLNLARLNPDGTLDVTFNPVVDGYVCGLALQHDLKIIVAGTFTVLAGQPCGGLGRLDAQGHFDPTFLNSRYNSAHVIAVQSDGRILVCGSCVDEFGEPCGCLGRLLPNGELDSSFNTDPVVWADAMAVQTDGRIVISSYVELVPGLPEQVVWRLNADGSRDPSFDFRADNYVHGLALQPDGKVIVGGRFKRFDGKPRSGIVRVGNTMPAKSGLSVNGTDVTWTVEGAAPQATWVTFDVSTNGVDWLPLGIGEPVPGGWRLTGVSLPPEATVRALGFVASAYWQGSGWFASASAGPPLIGRQPAARTNDFGSLATLAVLAEGSPPLGYQWRKNDVSLQDHGHIRGAHSATLTLNGVSGADQGDYTVVVSNPYGSVTSVVAFLKVRDPVVRIQPTDQLATQGQTVSFAVEADGTAPVSLQWRKDGRDIPGQTGSVLTVTNVQWADSGEYEVTVSNVWGTVLSEPAVLAFGAGADAFNPGANGSVHALAVELGGKILVGGSFTTLGGQNRERIGRLNSDGSLDKGFGASSDGTVYAISVQGDGKIIVGGKFALVNGQPMSCIARLDANGTIDADFRPEAAGTVYCLALQEDGRILIGGAFTNVCGTPQARIARLNPDGSLDATFKASAGDDVFAIAIDPDGNVLVGGAFRTLCGQACQFLGRLTPNGDLDTTFRGNADDHVHALAVQSDGAVLVGGKFMHLNGRMRSKLGRFNADGALDDTFNPAPDSTVFALALQTDGRILVGGQFFVLGGRISDPLVRLRPNGSLDTTFTPTAGWAVLALAIQEDGAVAVGGSFGRLASQPRGGIGRITNSYPARQSLSLNDTTLVWHRGGASPEIVRASFEVSTNGADWQVLGNGLRMGDTWQLNGVSLPSNATVRARGWAATGYQCGSGTLFESSMGAPAISIQPLGRVNGAATPASLAVHAAGNQPFGYQWYRNGTPLEDDANVQGSRTATLSFGSVYGADAGDYQVVVTNNMGSVTSKVAVLTVLDPCLTSQPTSILTQAMSRAYMKVTASGTAPLAYQWYKDGVPLTSNMKISGVRDSMLVVRDVLGFDAGAYTVVVSNPVGVVTSAVAFLTVLDPFIKTQPTNQLGHVGGSVTFTGAVAGTLPFYYQWQKNSLPIPGANQPSLTITNVQQTDAGAYTLVVTNRFGAATSVVAQLAVNLAIPDAFNPITDGRVQCIAVQPDGKILVAGKFSTVAGQLRANIARLSPDGSLDLEFKPEVNDWVYTLAVQTDGKILLGGNFLTVAGQPRANLCRLNSDGSLDTSFNPGADGPVNALLVQPDGRIIVGGSFATLAGQRCSAIGRLKPDGTLDESFTGSADNSVHSIALQHDGKIILGGTMPNLSGYPCSYVGRLNPDGTRDMTFQARSGRFVYCLAVQPDGKILVGGEFSRFNDQTVGYFVRLTPDGAVENTFGSGADKYVNCFAIQADGKILVSGWFTTLAGQPRQYLGRFNPDGTLDNSFNPGAEGREVAAMAIETDGSILVGGMFNSLAGQPRNTLGRLRNTAPANDTFVIGSSEVAWLRTGTGPEFWRTSFEVSTDGASWTPLGDGTPITGGWRLQEATLPPYATLRVRGFVSGGGANSSTSFLEYMRTLIPPAPVFLLNASSPVVRAGRFGFDYTATLGQTVVVEGTTDLTNWAPLATNTVGLEPVGFSDPESPGAPHKFYRLRTP